MQRIRKVESSAGGLAIFTTLAYKGIKLPSKTRVAYIYETADAERHPITATHIPPSALIPPPPSTTRQEKLFCCY